jgi:phasin family protein
MEALGGGTRAQFAENAEYLRKLFAVRTPQDWMELQIQTATKTVERSVIQATRLGEIATETAQKGAQPLKARMEETAEAWTRPFVS